MNKFSITKGLLAGFVFALIGSAALASDVVQLVCNPQEGNQSPLSLSFDEDRNEVLWAGGRKCQDVEIKKTKMLCTDRGLFFSLDRVTGVLIVITRGEKYIRYQCERVQGVKF